MLEWMVFELRILPDEESYTVASSLAKYCKILDSSNNECLEAGLQMILEREFYLGQINLPTNWVSAKVIIQVRKLKWCPVM